VFAKLVPARTGIQFIWLLACCYIYIASLFSSVAHANGTLKPSLTFENLSVEDGLSQSTVFDIAQDQTGFLWIATMDGLNRYDGHNFKTYRHSASAEDSLPSNFIREIYISPANAIWVGTQTAWPDMTEIQMHLNNTFCQATNMISLFGGYLN